MSQNISWWCTSRRAQSKDDFETWNEGGVTPTLNSFDMGDTRATVIVFYGNRVNDIRIQGEVVNTLQARMGTGGGNMPLVAVENPSIVRRLTPKECERLMGFPDGHTDGQTDGHRYRQLGNAVAVPVVEFIIKRLVELHG